MKSLGLVLALLAGPAWSSTQIAYTNPDGVTASPVTKANPLPVTLPQGQSSNQIILPTSLLPYAFNNLDSSGNLGSQSAENCHVIKANPGNIYYLDTHEVAAGAATDYVFVINVTSCPSNGTMAAGTRILSSGALSPTQTWSWTPGGPIPMPASAGIVVVCSSTDWPTLTLDAHCLFNWGVE